MFGLVHTHEKQRVGTIKFEKCTLETPLYTVYTSRGCIPNLTPDTFKQTITIDDNSTCLVNLNFWDLLENPGETVVDNFKKHLTEKGITNNALHEFLNFNNYPLYINIRDPQYPQQTCQANEKCIFGDTEGGRKKADVESFYRYINALKPDLFTAMHDASTEDAPTAAAKPTKKMTKSFERTKKWIPQTKVENMITPLVGGQYVELKKKCIPWTSQGSGIHLGEISNVEPQKRYEILTSTIDLIENEQLVRFISGQDHPFEVLECVERGVDVFDGTYPFKLAEFGYASMYSLEGQKSQMKINLRDLSFARDTTAIMEGCTCPACKSYTRAYIHHLLNAHEMLAEVLLTMHNLHRYMRFFDTIRKHIKADTFLQFKQAFLTNQ